MADITRRVNVIFHYFQKGLKNISRNARGFNEVMGMTMETFKKSNKAQTSMITSGGNLARRMRLLTHGMRGFRMEMLGVMFFGMGMQKFFTGLLKPAMQLAGIFEIWSNTLAILFLPSALKLLDLLLPLSTWLINLSDSAKLTLGAFVLLGAAIGGLLFFVGMFTLGIGSLMIAWGTMVTVVFPFVAIATAIGAAVVTLIILWKNWENIAIRTKMFIAALSLALGFLAFALGAPIIAAIAGATAVIVGIMALIKNWQSVTEMFSNIWKTIFHSLPEPVQFAVDKIIGLFDNLWEKFGRVKNILKAVARFFPGGMPGLGLAELTMPELRRGTVEPTLTVSDMSTAVEEGMTSALDRALFKRPDFIGLITDPYQQTVRQTGGIE